MQEFKSCELNKTSSELKNETNSILRPLLKSRNVYSMRKRKRVDIIFCKSKIRILYALRSIPVASKNRL